MGRTSKGCWSVFCVCIYYVEGCLCTRIYIPFFSVVLLYCELYQLTNNHSLPPNTSSSSSHAPLEFGANAVSHAGVAQQHDRKAYDATMSQHMLIFV